MSDEITADLLKVRVQAAFAIRTPSGLVEVVADAIDVSGAEWAAFCDGAFGSEDLQQVVDAYRQRAGLSADQPGTASG
jgi:hypothetical protein